MSSILDQIPKDTFLTSSEPTIIYRLGIFKDATHYLVELYENIKYPTHFHLKVKWIHSLYYR